MGNEHSKQRGLRRRATVAGPVEQKGKQPPAARHRQRRKQRDSLTLEDGWVIMDNGNGVGPRGAPELGNAYEETPIEEDHDIEELGEKEKANAREEDHAQVGQPLDRGESPKVEAVAGGDKKQGDDHIVGNDPDAPGKKAKRKESKKRHKKDKKDRKAHHKKEAKAGGVIAAAERKIPEGGVESQEDRIYDDLPELVPEFGDAHAAHNDDEEDGREKRIDKGKEKEEKDADFDIVFAVKDGREEKNSGEADVSVGVEQEVVPSPPAPGESEGGSELRKEAEDVDESFIEQYLARLDEPEGQAANNGEQERVCLSCDRHFPAASPAFYPLANCSHAYCIDCLYNHLEQQLMSMDAEEDEEPYGKSKEVEADFALVDEWVVADEKKERVQKRANDGKRPVFKFVCPHQMCGSVISLNDLKAGFDVIGSLLARELKENGSLMGEKASLQEQERRNPEEDEALGQSEMFEVDLASDDAHRQCERDHKESEDPLARRLEDGDATEASHEEAAGDAQGSSSGNKLSNSLKMFLESNEGYVLCPNEKCRMIFEHLPPTAEEKAYMRKQAPVDDNGEPIQGDALEHYFDKRFRCRDCDTVFCSACKLVPYHLGFTCDDHKSYLVAQHCFVCDKVLRGDITPYLPEDFVVRDDDEADQKTAENGGADDVDKGKEKDEDQDEAEAEMQPFQPVFQHFDKPLPVPSEVSSIFFWKKRKLLKERHQLELEKREHERKEAARVALAMIQHESQRLEIKERRLAERRKREEKREQERMEAQKRKRAELVQRLRDGLEANITTVYVCDRAECKKEVEKKCLWKHKECGHACCGVYNEQTCLRCLDPDCAGDGQTKDDYCNICWVEDLGAKPSVALESCGHVFHLDCLQKKLEAGWPTAVISFSFLDCPLCNERLSHPLLTPHLKPFLELEEYLTKMAVERLSMEGMHNDSGAKENPAKYAINTFAFYLCYQCKAPYFGGKKECGRMLGEGEGEGAALAFNPKELICGACSNTLGQAACHVHGDAYMEWKCRFCCSLATYFCGGKARFCTPCHDRPAERVEFGNWTTLDTFKAPACDGVGSCPLHIQHPPNGTEEFCLGCSMCKTSGFRFGSTTQT